MKTMLGLGGCAVCYFGAARMLQLHFDASAASRDVGVCGRVDRQTFWCGAGGCGAVLVGWLWVAADRVMVVGGGGVWDGITRGLWLPPVP